MILKLGIQHRGLTINKFNINDESVLTLTYLRHGQISSHLCLSEESVSHLMGARSS